MPTPSAPRARRPREPKLPPPPPQAEAKPKAKPKAIEPPVTVSAADDDLEALFDQVAAQRAEAEKSAPAPAAPAPAAPAPAAPEAEDAFDVFHRIGMLTRNLHDALRELGYDKTVEDAVGSLPDARARLSYIASLTGQAAEKVLGAVEQGQGLQEALEIDARELSGGWEKLMRREMDVDGFRDLALHTREFLATMPERTARTSAVFTDIMVAQDFHDLTGQVIQRVVTVAQNLENQLLKLLIETTPEERRPTAADGWLTGPVVDSAGRDDVVTSQAQVDDLLESLGF